MQPLVPAWVLAEYDLSRAGPVAAVRAGRLSCSQCHEAVALHVVHVAAVGVLSPLLRLAETLMFLTVDPIAVDVVHVAVVEVVGCERIRVRWGKDYPIVPWDC